MANGAGALGAAVGDYHKQQPLMSRPMGRQQCREQLPKTAIAKYDTRSCYNCMGQLIVSFGSVERSYTLDFPDHVASEKER